MGFVLFNGVFILFVFKCILQFKRYFAISDGIFKMLEHITQPSFVCISVFRYIFALSQYLVVSSAPVKTTSTGSLGCCELGCIDSAVDCHERLVSRVACYVLSGTLNSAQSLNICTTLFTWEFTGGMEWHDSKHLSSDIILQLMLQFLSLLLWSLALQITLQCYSVWCLDALQVVLASVPDMQCGYSRELFLQWCSNSKNCIILTNRTQPGTLSRILVDNPLLRSITLDVCHVSCSVTVEIYSIVKS